MPDMTCMDCRMPLVVRHPDQPEWNRYDHTTREDAAYCTRPKERPWPLPRKEER